MCKVQWRLLIKSSLIDKIPGDKMFADKTLPQRKTLETVKNKKHRKNDKNYQNKSNLSHCAMFLVIRN